MYASHAATNAFKPAPMTLLPPIPLYRRVLRAHRKCLPRDMRLLGDEYVKAEFRAHRNVENPVHIVCFYLVLYLIRSFSLVTISLGL